MSPIFTGAATFLRPDDEELSPETAFKIQVYRLLTIAGAVGILVFGVVRAMASPTAVDPVSARLAVVALLGALVAASYLSPRVRRSYGTWMRGGIFIFMGWFSVVAALNNFTGSYSVGLLLTFAVLTAAVGFGATSLRPVLWFSGYGIGIVTVGALVAPAPRTHPAVIIASLTAVALTQTAVFYGRLAARKTLKERTGRLQRTSARLEALFESSPDMINVYDTKGNLIDPNSRLLEKTGYDEGEIEEMKVWDLDETLSPERARALWREMERGDQRKREARFVRKDGTTFPVEVHVRRLDLEGDDRFVAISRDISQRKQREEELRRKERRFQAVFDDPGILVGRVAPDGTLLDVNQTAMKYVDAPAEEVVGKLFWETPWWQESYRPRLRKKIEQAASGTYVEFEADHVTSDGETRRVSGVVRPVTNEEGEVISLMASARDVTERRRHQQKLERYREYTDRLLDGIDDLFFVHDENGKLKRWNETFAEVTGYSDEELGAMDGIDFVPADDRDRAAERIRRVFEEGHALLEAPILCKDGSTIPYEFAASRVQHPDGEARLVGVGRDITEREARERELRRSRERWQRLVDSHQDGIQVSVGGTIRYINDAGARILGAERPSQVLGEPLGRLLGSDLDEEDIDDRLDRLRRGEPTEPREQKVLGLDGESRIVESYSVPIEFEGKAATQTVLRDVTDRRAMEENIRERRQKVESLYTATGQLLAAESREAVSDRIHKVLRDVFDFPLTGIEFASGGRLEPERMTLPNGTDVPGPEALDVDGESISARAYRSGERVVVDDVSTLENEIEYDELRSAAAVPFGRHGVVVIGQTRDEAFDPFDLRLIEILTAQASVVLDALQRFEALQQSERRFRGIFENAAVGMAVLDEEGYLLEVNPVLREMTGYEAGELEGTHFEMLTHSDDVAEDRRLYEELIRGERDRYQMEKRYVRKGGEVFWGRLTVSRHEGHDQGQVVGMVEDIDDQKRYEEELREAKEEAERMNRLKSAFLANMSHEIRTPLTSIIGFAEAIGDEVDALERHLDTSEVGTLSRFSSLIKQGGHRLMETLDAVLNLSKLEAGEMELTIEPVDLASEVEEAADLFERQAMQSELDLQAECDEAPIWGRADEGGFRIALRNLVSNAIKYTEAGGTVWLRVGRANGEATVEVEDTGVGMDPEQVPELFEAFKQESEGVGREFEGSGLGLAVTQRIVNQMGGSIEVETEKGEGTCFTIRVPISEAEPTS